MSKSLINFLLLIVMMPVSVSLPGQKVEEVKVWQDRTPVGFNTGDSAEAVMYIHSPSVEVNTGTAIIICPGGGYQKLAIDHEGHDVAKWLASNGITGIVLKYRLPHGNRNIPISDVREATRYIRKMSEKLSINPDRIGVMGFSAGGHLASTHLTFLDDELSRPNFGVLFYPVITGDERYSHKGSFNNLLGDNASDERLRKYSNELNVTPQTPPVIMFHSDDDRVLPINSILFYEGLKKNGVPAAMYIFPSGGHGWGFRDSFSYHEVWKSLLMEWLRHLPKQK